MRYTILVELVFFITILDSYLLSSDDSIFYGTDDGKCHHSTCILFSGEDIDKGFDMEEDARDGGYEPCDMCR